MVTQWMKMDQMRNIKPWWYVFLLACVIICFIGLNKEIPKNAAGEKAINVELNPQPWQVNSVNIIG